MFSTKLAIISKTKREKVETFSLHSQSNCYSPLWLYPFCVFSFVVSFSLCWLDKTLPQVHGGAVFTPKCIKTKKSQKTLRLDFERKTRVCPSAPHSVYQAIAFAQYYTPNSRDTWVVSRCRFRVRLLPYKLQNYSCLRQIYE